MKCLLHEVFVTHCNYCDSCVKDSCLILHSAVNHMTANDGMTV